MSASPLRSRRRCKTLSARAGNLLWCFSAGTPVVEYLPARMLRLDLPAAKTFILAIVPLHQIRVDHCNGLKAGQFAGAGGAVQGTGKYLHKMELGQSFAKPAGVSFAPLGQRQIGKPRMLARDSTESRRVAPDESSVVLYSSQSIVIQYDDLLPCLQ